MKTDFESPLANGIRAFLKYKRALGKRLAKPELVYRLLDAYLVEHGVTVLQDITPDLLDAFVLSRPRHSSRSFNGLVSILRGLFDWLTLQEMFAVSPLRTPKRRVIQGRRPFLFTPDQVKQLLEEAARLRTNSGLVRGRIYRMIFTLLFGLGLRVGEVSRLCRKDVDLDRRLLVIRQTKFGKDRLVPFGPKIACEISRYLSIEEASGRLPADAPVFSFARNRHRPVSPKTISWTFHTLLPALGLNVPPGVSPPHLHCLRHSFAVSTLLHWYRSGLDPAARLLDLSTFLGHACPSSTAIYLTITAELLECASSRFADFAAPAVKELKP